MLALRKWLPMSLLASLLGPAALVAACGSSTAGAHDAAVDSANLPDAGVDSSDANPTDGAPEACPAEIQVIGLPGWPFNPGCTGPFGCDIPPDCSFAVVGYFSPPPGATDADIAQCASCWGPFHYDAARCEDGSVEIDMNGSPSSVEECCDCFPTQDAGE